MVDAFQGVYMDDTLIIKACLKIVESDIQKYEDYCIGLKNSQMSTSKI